MSINAPHLLGGAGRLYFITECPNIPPRKLFGVFPHSMSIPPVNIPRV
jgi:hypothetical protein